MVGVNVKSRDNSPKDKSKDKVARILFITTYPPRECGIATYSQDLISALRAKFGSSIQVNICALACNFEPHEYNDDVSCVLNTDDESDFEKIAKIVNRTDIDIVVLQHEFGLFRNNENKLLYMLDEITVPVVMAFHTILPNPSTTHRSIVLELASRVISIVVMTNSSAQILSEEYGIDMQKISVIAHGTHLVEHKDKLLLKSKYGMSGRSVLSTFGLLSSGKSIETTLYALPKIIDSNPDVLFLIIGKTHPTVFKNEGEAYRTFLMEKVLELGIKNHVKFINRFLPLLDLLDCLQLTDVYIFTSKDPYQAVSGTFSYAISCGCPIISTPIPHACEVLRDNSGIIIGFNDHVQLADAVNSLLSDDKKRINMISDGLHQISSTAWENSAIAHALLFKNNIPKQIILQYEMPAINFRHIQKMTTGFGILQFSKLNRPDTDSGYTLDDNARALIVMCQYYELTKQIEAIQYIKLYVGVVRFAQQEDGTFLNYIDDKGCFTSQNDIVNLSDSNGRAIWALGYVISLRDILPQDIVCDADAMMKKVLKNIENEYSTRSMAFIIKGLYYYTLGGLELDEVIVGLVKILADRLVQMYRHESREDWKWFENYFTYGNSLLPDAMLCAWLVTGDIEYKSVAKASFDFYMSKIWQGQMLTAISNKSWLYRHEFNTYDLNLGGEQPIEIAYTVIALEKFVEVFDDIEYLKILQSAFSWFLGNNRLNQIVYNPCTGGCYDGIEEHAVNLNQGAESTISYLMARLIIAKRNKELVGIS